MVTHTHTHTHTHGMINITLGMKTDIPNELGFAGILGCVVHIYVLALRIEEKSKNKFYKPFKSLEETSLKLVSTFV